MSDKGAQDTGEEASVEARHRCQGAQLTNLGGAPVGVLEVVDRVDGGDARCEPELSGVSRECDLGAGYADLRLA